MQSVVSYPDRGNWGNPKWRGNTSGYIIKDLIEHFKPSLFVDVCEGSGTSGDVCRELGIEYVGLDLHKGNDFTKDYVLSQLPRPADIVFSHPPYHSMIQYMMSNKTHYGGKFIPIMHEYLLIWRKSAKSLFAVAWNTAKELKHQMAFTWRSAIRIALMKLGGQATLQEIYQEVEKIAQPLIQKNKHWRAKIRQQLQYHFSHVQRGVWAM